MNKEAKISIIIPVYNVEKYLKRCLESVVNQTYKNLEIILVNDGSTDSSLEICNDYADKDPRVLVINQDNKGLSGARNSGLEIAKGDYIGFVDSDDWIETNMFSTMIKVLKDKKVDVVECSLLTTTDVKNTVYRNGQLIIENRQSSLKRIIKNQNFSVCSRLHKRSSIADLRFIEGKNSEDVYFTINLYNKINTTAFLTHKFYNYYVADNSITRGDYKLKVLDSVEAALYLKNKIHKEESDKTLKNISRNLLLDIALYNYKMLNYNSNLDPKLVLRKKLKAIIKENYNKSSNSSLHLKLARFLPVNAFNLLIKLNN